ncbi:MAG: LamB/YcsF family protein [Gemmatimonadetes bacterium]|nr:LamB/YcsF family protein [Gemmatimonadota bacterium]
MTSVDLNADLGEGFGRYRLDSDLELLGLVSSANVACGFHAGDPTVMRETVSRAAARRVAIGAHPSYPDLVGFGRRELGATVEQIEADVVYQIGALAAFCVGNGARLRYVKPHGALYNRAATEAPVARAIVRAIRSVDPELMLLGLDGSAMIAEAESEGVRAAREAFVDRAYLADGRLVPRGQPGAVLDDVAAVVERAVRMVTERFVIAIDGTRRIVRPDSLCVHGDGPHAVAIVRALRERLEAIGIDIAPFAR